MALRDRSSPLSLTHFSHYLSTDHNYTTTPTKLPPYTPYPASALVIRAVHSNTSVTCLTCLSMVSLRSLFLSCRVPLPTLISLVASRKREYGDPASAGAARLLRQVVPSQCSRLRHAHPCPVLTAPCHCHCPRSQPPSCPLVSRPSLVLHATQATHAVAPVPANGKTCGAS